MVASGLGGTRMTYPVVHLNCTKNPLCLYKYIWWFLKLVCDTGWFVPVPCRCFSVIVISETICICISSDFFLLCLYYIKLHYITLSNYLIYASLLSLLQLFFCLHVRLLYAIKYYLLTYLQHSNGWVTLDKRFLQLVKETQLRTGRLKMQDCKMTDESARLENDGLENDLFLRHRLGVVLELRCR